MNQNDHQNEYQSYPYLKEIDMIGKLADMKDDLYNNTVLLTTIVELLIAKNIFSEQEFLDKINKKEVEILSEI